MTQYALFNYGILEFQKRHPLAPENLEFLRQKLEFLRLKIPKKTQIKQENSRF
ncbi:MAG: hypothetical protein MR964_05500 [Campylobacter sp.]|uniref:hypothetical protein n=1 Tax=Campylobacter sp. TaxID=205 RepID=UPI002AA7083D|nr:hypothetical protein [Campylobacter sp.]MCI7023655.1 hypothetical protein [Campylobacter sp.]